MLAILCWNCILNEHIIGIGIGDLIVQEDSYPYKSMTGMAFSLFPLA